MNTYTPKISIQAWKNLPIYHNIGDNTPVRVSCDKVRNAVVMTKPIRMKRFKEECRKENMTYLNGELTQGKKVLSIQIDVVH